MTNRLPYSGCPVSVSSGMLPGPDQNRQASSRSAGNGSGSAIQGTILPVAAERERERERVEL